MNAGNAFARARRRVEERLADFAYPIVFEDPEVGERPIGGDRAHWCGEPLRIRIRTPAAAERVARADPLGFLEAYLAGEAELEGNLYLLSDVRAHAHFDVAWWRLPQALLRARTSMRFQTPLRARANTQSHYDIPQPALDTYLDRTYRSYSCAMFEEPAVLARDTLTRPGHGRADTFDSLEKAQWRKFHDAIAFLDPTSGDTLLDVGCGYGGQLQVALEDPGFRHCVGWTHSRNQVEVGTRELESRSAKGFELREGDYRAEGRVFDHVTSTGMVSHVGPRGLIPYVRFIRARIRTGGRYVHHALMTPFNPKPLDFFVGTLFHKIHVWPGYHWFTLAEHVSALERNGFEVKGVRNLSAHYAKTTAAWYERMMARREDMERWLGAPTFRAWRLYLAGSSGNFLNHGIHVYRIYAEAV